MRVLLAAHLCVGALAQLKNDTITSLSIVTSSNLSQYKNYTEVDPCSAVAKFNATKFPESSLKPSDINACLARIPMNMTSAEDLINGTLQMLDIYSYEDYEINSRNYQLPVRVNLRLRLENMRGNLTNIESLPEFSRQVFELMNSLNDGHTEIAIDCGARVAFDAFLPIALLAPTSNSPAEVMVLPAYDQFLLDRRINNTDQFALHKSLAGARIDQIEGRNTLDYLVGLISDTSVLFGNIDPQTRFNQLFVNLRGHPTPRMGYGTAFTSLGRSRIEKNTLNIRVTFGNSTQGEFELPWYGMIDTDYSKAKDHMDFTDYYTNYVCQRGNLTEFLHLAKNDTNQRSREEEIMPLRIRDRTVLYDPELPFIRNAPDHISPVSVHHYDKHNNTVEPTSKTVIPSKDSDLELIAGVDSGFHIYHFQNTSVGVMYMTNFFSSEVEKKHTPFYERFESKYRIQMEKGLKELKVRGVDTLLIEVAGNNGGEVELGSLTMLSLFPLQYPGFPSVVRSNNETFTYLNNSDAENSLSRVDGSRFTSLSDWLYERNTTLNINGVSDSYSQLVIDDIKNKTQWEIIANASFPVQNLFLPENILIVTNGKCASTCAQVTMYLQDVHGVKSVGFGGIPGSETQLQTVGGVRGAQVLEMLSPNPAECMYNFSMRVDQMTINFRSAIHYEQRIPTEFVTRNVDYVYQHTMSTYNSLENTWRFVAEQHFSNAMRTVPIAMESRAIEWKPLVEYPSGWYDRVLALESSLRRNSLGVDQGDVFSTPL